MCDIMRIIYTSHDHVHVITKFNSKRRYLYNKFGLSFLRVLKKTEDIKMGPHNNSAQNCRILTKLGTHFNILQAKFKVQLFSRIMNLDPAL